MLFDFRGSRNKLAQSTILDLITFGLGYGFLDFRWVRRKARWAERSVGLVEQRSDLRVRSD